MIDRASGAIMNIIKKDTVLIKQIVGAKDEETLNRLPQVFRFQAIDQEDQNKISTFSQNDNLAFAFIQIID